MLLYSRIDEDVHQSIPNLQELYLTNCEIQELNDIDHLAGFKKLEYLSLMRNPVTHRQHYRLYVIHKLPNVRVLDFRKIRLKVFLIKLFQIYLWQIPY